jgi:excisionase family DNA binding protein
MNAHGTASHRDRFLTIAEAAAVFNTSERFPRRLIAERRIEFVRFGRHVRIPERAIAAYVAAGTVDPLPTIRRHGQGRAP